ncbi:MAG: hypothetical protein EA406_02965 [Rhodospirillales bacterium]|nr:MAG: hypothetical protein EA406_02965 [Rhodospirillales bacterium]
MNDTAPPRIESLKVENYRALRTIQFDRLTPLTVLLGANGSGKSTVFDVFAFLAECFEACNMSVHRIEALLQGSVLNRTDHVLLTPAIFSVLSTKPRRTA